MKARHILFALIGIALCLCSCGDSRQKLEKRALELCRYIPDHELLADARHYMTPELYNAIAEAFELAQDDPMEAEWLYYFVTGNGGTTPKFKVSSLDIVDEKHAVAYILVHQVWEDSSPANDDEDTHIMEMEKVNGEWLMSDFDHRKEQCITYIENTMREQAVVNTISDYLINHFGEQYLKGDICIPYIRIVATEESEDNEALVWGDYWVFWYTQQADTLFCVSGGAHPGLMHLCLNQDDELEVTAFDAVEDGSRYLPSAKTIFQQHFNNFQNIASDHQTREWMIIDQVDTYLRKHDIKARYIKQYGQEPVEID